MLGLTHFTTPRRIELDPHLLWREARATLAHEIVHIERGAPQEETRHVEEAICDLVAASRLLPAWLIERLPGLPESDDEALAVEHQVDAPTINAARELGRSVKRLNGQ